jgi:four helix bundle protein
MRRRRPINRLETFAAEGNGNRSYTDLARFVDIACGSGLECAACIDALVARKLLEPEPCLQCVTRMFSVNEVMVVLLDEIDFHET